MIHFIDIQGDSTFIARSQIVQIGFTQVTDVIQGRINTVSVDVHLVDGTGTNISMHKPDAATLIMDLQRENRKAKFNDN